MSNLRTFLTFLLNWQQLSSFSWAWTLTRLRVPRNNVSLDRELHCLRLDDIALCIQRQHEFVLAGYHDAKSLKVGVGAVFSLNSSQQIRVDIDQLHFIVQSAEELFILNELFVGGIYNLHSSSPVLVWDIGMNVGFASLYFASKAEVVSVASYEPFQPTYQQALRNYALNPDLAQKIAPCNVGVGDEERDMVADYCSEFKGSVGINGIPASVTPTGKITQEKLTIKSATAILEELTKLHPNVNIVAKVDCEGAEYEIIENLADANLLGKVSFFIIEWHLQGPQEIVETLMGAGFMVISQSPRSRGTGLIYAVRSPE